MELRGWGAPDAVTATAAAIAIVLAIGSFGFTYYRTEHSDSFDAEALLNQAWRQARQGNLEEAAELIYLAELKDVESPRGPAYRGYLQFLRQGVEQALPYYEEALEREPDYAVGRIFLADALRQTDQFDAANEQLDLALELASRDRLQDVGLLASIYLSRGNVQSRQGLTAAALESFLRAAKVDPSSSMSQLALADLYFDSGEYEEALAVYDEVLAREPRVAGHWSSVGRLLLLLERYEPAEYAMRRSLELEPRAPGHDILALAVREQGREEEADLILRQSWRLKDLRSLE